MNLTLPNDQDFYWKDGSLWCEGVSLETLARKFGTPLYVYSKHALVSAFNAYQSALADYPHLVCFALKANSNLSIIKLFGELGSGFDIVSGGELQRVKAAGCDTRKVIFSGVGKTVREIREALLADIKCFNIESPRNSTVSSRSHPNLNCAQESPSASTRMWMLNSSLYFYRLKKE